jgi:cell division protein FtsB
MTKGKNKKTDKPRSSTVTWSQFLAIILITIALAVVLEYGHRATVSAGLERESQQLEREVATLEAEYRALQIERDRVQTDEYVEEWARTEGMMVLQGETPVVPLPARPTALQEKAAPTPAPTVVGSASESRGETSSHWPEWWALFFGPDGKSGREAED